MREAVAAHHANNYMPLVARHHRHDRATMFAFAMVVGLEAASADRSVLDAAAQALAHAHLTRDFIADRVDGIVWSTCRSPRSSGSASCRDRDRPGRLNRRHFEACVVTYLAAVHLPRGRAADGRCRSPWLAGIRQFGPPGCCPGRTAKCCSARSAPRRACRRAGGRSATRCAQTLTHYAATVDAGHPDNSDLVIDEASGKPSLRRRRAKPGDPGVLALEQAIKEHMPERTLLEILACTAYWLEWWRRFGPACGSDPKLADPLLRYVLTRSPTAATWVRRRPRATSAGCPRTSAARRRRGTSRRASSTARDRLHADRRRHDLQVSP